MPDTFVKIASVTVGSGGAASIEFTAIPGTYTDLCLKLSARGNASGIDAADITFNNSSSNFTYRSIFGDGSSAASYSGTNPQIQYLPGNAQTSNTFNSAELYIPNYSGSNNKSFSVDQVQETNATTAYIVPFAGLWSDTAAITSIKIDPVNGNFVQYSSAFLYGISKS